jgi:hypothetical protein
MSFSTPTNKSDNISQITAPFRIRQCDGCETAKEACRGVEGYACDRCKRLKKKCVLAARGAVGGAKKVVRKGKEKATNPIPRRKPIPMVEIPVKRKVPAKGASSSKRTLSDVEPDSEPEVDEARDFEVPVHGLKRPRVNDGFDENLTYMWQVANKSQNDIAMLAEQLAVYTASVNSRLSMFTQQLNRIRANNANLITQLEIVAVKTRESK